MKNLLLVIMFLVSACVHQPPSLYEELGGHVGVEKIADNFIDEISFNKIIFEYFKDTNIDRFRKKFIEHICVHSGGPCIYSGDSMHDVHAGMAITEHDFTLTVELLINAMNAADIAYPLQNRLLKQLAPMRKDMLEYP